MPHSARSRSAGSRRVRFTSACSRRVAPQRLTCRTPPRGQRSDQQSPRPHLYDTTPYDSRQRAPDGLTLGCGVGSTGLLFSLGRYSWHAWRTGIRTGARCRVGSWCRFWRPAPVLWWPGQVARQRRPGRRHRRPPSPIRRAISARAALRPPISGTLTSSQSTRSSTPSRSPTRRSSVCTPVFCGPRARRGARKGAIWCGATSPTIVRCAGRRTTVASACSAIRRTTATATRSTSRVGSSPASISPAAWCATSTTER